MTVKNAVFAIIIIRVICVLVFDFPNHPVLQAANKKRSPLMVRPFTIMGVSKTNYFLLEMVLADGDEPEINTERTDLNKLKKLNEGL